MQNEIGSDFFEYSLQKTENEYLNINGIDKHYNKEFFISGRSAIRAIAKNLKNKKKTILMPMYVCESMCNPFLKEGWEIAYYDVNIDLSINNVDLIDKKRDYEPSAVLVVNYFGFDTLEKSHSLLSDLRKEGIIVIEDITHSMYSTFKKTEADYYVASLRKWNAMPEGGILYFKDKLSIKKCENDQIVTDEFLKAFDLKKVYFEGKINKNEMRKAYSKAKKLITEYDDIYDMSIVAKKILYNVNHKELVEKRKINYETLSCGLRNVRWIHILKDKIDKKIVPLYFPIYIKNKDQRLKLQQYLSKENIYCPIIWPAANETTGYSSQYIYEHILCIPVDQRYNAEDMNRVISIIKSYPYENCCPDVYYNPVWGKINQEHDGGLYKCFYFKCEYGNILYPMILKELPSLINDCRYYDAVTPYGFNGPVITKEKNRDKLLIEFEKGLNDYCVENNIIAEYIRFSPWLKNAEYMKCIYTLKPNNMTYYIDLNCDFFQEEFSSNCRNVIRKAQKKGVKIIFDFEKKYVNEFFKLYELMTEKNKVNSFYKFDSDYIYDLIYKMKDNLFLAHAMIEDKIISSAIFMFNEDYIHYHLSGNDYEYFNYGANSLLLFEVANWAKSIGISEFHLGGASHESLFNFKKQFTKHGYLEYKVGMRISNNKVYEEACSILGKKENYFPEYR